ncbi:hypothetical protein [Hymenobacter guriensis]|uniref:Uncharacterized protein n=1 Tax=Hymenobacter guriensis TaxID=2793065 RepID=A0ABS0L7Y7_9BACT|nr:hypothetical protein [Hymenobacter guriensis]MBG8556268.1 hypothetical protein [Hymenobacter guriensis]
MLTKRTLLLIVPGLLASYAAAAPTPAATGPTPGSLLSLAAWGLAAVVLIFGMMTATSLASAAAAAAQQEAGQQEAVQADGLAAAPTETPAPATAGQRIAA